MSEQDFKTLTVAGPDGVEHTYRLRKMNAKAQTLSMGLVLEAYRASHPATDEELTDEMILEWFNDNQDAEIMQGMSINFAWIPEPGSPKLWDLMDDITFTTEQHGIYLAGLAFFGTSAPSNAVALSATSKRTAKRPASRTSKKAPSRSRR